MPALDDRAIARWRLHSQGLAGARSRDDTEAVRRLLGVQAENHDQAMWAVATRPTAPDRARFERLFDDGAVLRTHVLRSTWHFVTADVRWLLELTEPRIRPQYRQAQAEEGLTDGDVDRSREVIARALAGGVHLTRDEVGERLGAEGIAARGRRLAVVLAHAELDGLVCSGARRGRHHTYALLSERVPTSRRLDGDEALAQLVLRYVTGHGPVTERDVAYWATLTLADVRAGLQAVADSLERFELDGRTYWHAGGPPARIDSDRAHLLQILDELYRGYQDSRWVLDADHLLPRGREAILGMAVVDGQVIGRVRRRVDRSAIRFDVHELRPWTAEERRRVDDAADRHGRFFARPAVVALAA